MKTPKVRTEKSAVQLAEESVHLLRHAPAHAIVCYLAGTMPFLLASLYFVTDMSQSAFAEERLWLASLGLACLFVVMKCAQSMFASRLLAHLAGEPPPRWNKTRLLRTAAQQALVQPAGLVLIPISLLLLLPFGWVYAFFTSATVLGGEEHPSLRSLWGRVWSQTFLWPLQNHYLLMMYKLLYWFIFINLSLFLFLLPILYRMLLGEETMFSASPLAMLNTTFFTVGLCLSYLCLDPLIKTTYVLRCFHGESLRTGRDLRADLMRQQTEARTTVLRPQNAA